ncbi:hypothetical protein NQ318_021100 [Aromia moschata]|uniref:Transposase n=1 Tax=Aromia moschata TaxID=1265417 RepID=A0AAV8XUV8_9CUCU|nr:hypothetical protein NQ318_021100 [Aromia moschata]
MFTAAVSNRRPQIKTLVLENRHMSVKELAQECDISTMWAHGILSDILDMKRVAARLVPKELNVLQKKHRKQVDLDMVSNQQQKSIETKLQFRPRFATVDLPGKLLRKQLFIVQWHKIFKILQGSVINIIKR